MKRTVRSIFSGVGLAFALAACQASGTLPAGAAHNGVVLMRTYFLAIRPDARMGKVRPSLECFAHAGGLPGGQDGKAQRFALAQRFTLPDLAFQYSDTAPVGVGDDATLKMGFGETIQVEVRNLWPEADGRLTADFDFRFGRKEVLRDRISFHPGDAVVFAGRLDSSLPILSVFTLETRLFSLDHEKEKDEFLAQSTRDLKDFAPAPPPQRSEEPYLPGVGDVTMPELIASEKAVYPDSARTSRLDGQVIVEVIVDHEGMATNPRILSASDPVFVPAALEAAKTYRYKPALKGGSPVSVVMNLIMLFQFTARPGL